MPVVRIEHAVPDFERWQQAFASDPADRKGSGVRRYQVYRLTDDPNYVMIDLEFDSMSQAEATLTSLRELWSRVEGQIMRNPQARIVEVVESKEY